MVKLNIKIHETEPDYFLIGLTDEKDKEKYKKSIRKLQIKTRKANRDSLVMLNEEMLRILEDKDGVIASGDEVKQAINVFVLMEEVYKRG